MRRIYFIQILIVFLVLQAWVGSKVNRLFAEDPRHTTRLQQVVEQGCEAFLQRMVLEEHFSGVALVMRNTEVMHAKGYGRATAGDNNSVDTVFHVASITKQFTAAAVLQLVEAGKIELDRSINEYLPQKYRSPQWDRVNCSHLLSHSSGIEDYALVRDYYNVVDGFCLGNTVDGMIREAMAKSLRFEPGSRFEYSNIGFTLVGEIIENQTSMPYDEYLKTHVLRPMGMNSSRIHAIGHEPNEKEASGHRWDSERGQHVKDDILSLPVTAPDGGLATTLSDFVKWTRTYTEKESPIISRTSLRKMTTPKILTQQKDERGGPLAYGYGLFVGDGLLGHPGYIVGFRSHFIIDIEKNLLVVVFSNNTTNNPRRIARGLLKIADSEIEN
jgi:CubicO group peptidase (beta-lactamase class C family)